MWFLVELPCQGAVVQRPSLSPWRHVFVAEVSDLEVEQLYAAAFLLILASQG